MSRMFNEVTRTWNPVVGCRHGCTYCWARELALGQLKDTPRYRDGFEPRLIEEELRRRFQKGLIFTVDMGDLWGAWVPREWIERVLKVVRASPKATFLMLTKNPDRYLEFLEIMPPNVILGATIETNRDYAGISQAPSVMRRAMAMKRLPETYRKMVSIEPIMKFDLDSLQVMMRGINPELVYVGHDNHQHQLPEPSLEKTQALIDGLRLFTEVREKTIRKAWWEEKS